MEIKIKKILKSNRQEALNLVLKVFMEFVAADYSEEGVKTFKDYIADKELSKHLNMNGAYYKGHLIGVIATKNEGNHIVLLFVSGNFHRQGVARKLFEVSIGNSADKSITVNSSPHAIEVYYKLGFIETDVEHIDDGVRYTPMIYIKK